MVTPEEARKCAAVYEKAAADLRLFDSSQSNNYKIAAQALRDLAAQVEALQADAQRYRHIRDNDFTELYCSWIDELLNAKEVDADEFDAAIDAARKDQP